VLFIHAGFLAEGLALVQDPQRLLGDSGFVSAGGGAADVALGEPLEHPDALDAGAGVQEPADQGGDGQVTRGVAQLAVLAGGADQLLLFPVPQHPGGDPDPLGEPGDGHQLVLHGAASAIRALLAAGITLRGGLAAQLISGSALSSAVNNLPAAAALRSAGTAGLWVAILATAIGPDLLITGSVATLICRRIARDAGTGLRTWQFTAIGAALVPAQLAVAVIGLHVTGALR
jgi:hypothetical protein